MPYLVQVGATILCSHGGSATITPGQPRVKLSGQPAVALTDLMTVTGCTFAPGGVYTPCTTAQWMSGAARVTIGGVPAVTQSSNSLSIPNGTPMSIVSTQVKVQGT